MLFWFTALSAISAAQSGEEIDGQTAFKMLFGTIEVSCNALIIAEYESAEHGGDELFGKGSPRVIDFDKAQCARRLASTQFSTYLQLLFDSMTLADAEQPSMDERVAKETPADREERMKKDDAQMALMQDDLQRNIRPLVSLCHELGEKYNGKHNRVCFFGAPSTSAGRPFGALFRAMMDNTQPSNETLCAPDPIHRDKSIVPEFLSFLDANEKTLSWADVQRSLLNDKFECRGEGDFERCNRALMTLTIPSAHGKENDGYFESFVAKDGAVIIPRLLTAYRGNWQIIGSNSDCPVDAEGKAIEGCDSLVPQRGSKSGICLANEDWHVWGHMTFLFNKLNEGE